METWLITGAGGFLGSNLGYFLQDRARSVGAFHRLPRQPRMFHHSVGIDLRDKDRLAALVDEIKPDVIVHAAALSGHEACAQDPLLARQVNVTSTTDLVELAQSISARFIYVSTDAVFDGTTGDYRESDPTKPFSVYGQTKAQGEIAALSDPAALVVRTNFFGWSPTGHASILEFFRNALRAGSKVDGYTDFIVSSIYVQQLAQGIWDLYASQAAGIVHVASADALSKFDFGRAVAAEFGLDAGLIEPRSAGLGAHVADRRRNLSLNVERFAGLVGAAPTQRGGVAVARQQEADVLAAFGSPT